MGEIIPSEKTKAVVAALIAKLCGPSFAPVPTTAFQLASTTSRSDLEQTIGPVLGDPPVPPEEEV